MRMFLIKCIFTNINGISSTLRWFYRVFKQYLGICNSQFIVFVLWKNKKYNKKQFLVITSEHYLR